MTEAPSPLETAFGLKVDPFLDHPGDAWFYADPMVMQRIDLLLHLLQFGETLILVQGPEGSGKSTLLGQLRRRIPPNWRASVLAGGQIHSDAELVTALGHDFPDLSQEAGESFGQALLRHAQALQQQGGLAVVLVDDAHRLEDACLTALLTLGGDARTTCRQLRLLLLGNPGLEQRLIRLGLHRPQAGSLQSLEMPRFDEQQCAAYLMYRLAVAGYSGESPFSATEIRAFCKRSEGWPGPLNALASEALRDHAQRRHRGPVGAPAHARPPARRLPAAAWGALAITGLAAGGLMWLWQHGNSPPATGETDLPLPLPAPTTAPPATSVPGPNPVRRAPTPTAMPAASSGETVPPQANPPAVPGGPSPTPVPADRRLTPTRPVPAPPPAAPTAAQAEPGTTAANPKPPAAAANPRPPATTAPPRPARPAPGTVTAGAARPAGPPPGPAPRASTSKPGTAPKPPTARAASASPSASPATRPAAPAPSRQGRKSPFDQWLAAQPRTHFTIQLLGVRDRRAAERFLARAGLDPRTTGIVETRYHGHPWYVVVHGSFPDRAAAKAAIAHLPARLRRNQPWPRTFGSL